MTVGVLALTRPTRGNVANIPELVFSEKEAAEALARVVGQSRWEAVALAHGYLDLLAKGDEKTAARITFERGPFTLKKSIEKLTQARTAGIRSILTPREKIGSAENPVTKLFPAAIAEERFFELLDELRKLRPALDYEDQRKSGHTLLDVKLREGKQELPINIKTATTAFNRAKDLVGIEPEDCLPIPAYKANGALEEHPDLVYIITVDYKLLGILDPLLASLFTRDEAIAWRLLHDYAGAHVRSAEDEFVQSVIKRHWPTIKAKVDHPPFHVISARKAIRILQTIPKRTPGIGLRAWGTGARAEVNVHLSIKSDTKPWLEIRDRIKAHGVESILKAINKKRVEEVPDPEI